MTFIQYLQKYGVNYEIKYLSYVPNPDRHSKKLGYKLPLIGVMAHTEGAVKDIPGTSDRHVYSYFNDPANAANAHAFICFSGKVYIYVSPNHGSWHSGNEEDNCRMFSCETQDNGRYNDPKTYTEAQYNAWSRLYCAVKEWAKQDYGSDIMFVRGLNGLRGHKEVSLKRVCPGALDLDKILTMAAEIWEYFNPSIPEWKLQTKPIQTGLKTYIVQKDIPLVNFETNENVLVVSAGTVITVHYVYNQYYLTKSSYDGVRPTGFKITDLEYIAPIPEVPEYPFPQPVEPSHPKAGVLELVINLIKNILKFITNIKK